MIGREHWTAGPGGPIVHADERTTSVPSGNDRRVALGSGLRAATQIPIAEFRAPRLGTLPVPHPHAEVQRIERSQIPVVLVEHPERTGRMDLVSDLAAPIEDQAICVTHHDRRENVVETPFAKNIWSKPVPIRTPPADVEGEQVQSRRHDFPVAVFVEIHS